MVLANKDSAAYLGQCPKTSSSKYRHFLVVSGCISHIFVRFDEQVSCLGCKTFCHVSRTFHDYSME